MVSIALRFAGPLQSWAGKSVVKTRVDTERMPTPRAIKGMLAAAFGIPRDKEYPKIIQNAEIEVVPVKNGRIIKDYQTIGLRADEDEFLERIGRILKRGKLFTNVDRLTPDNEKKNSSVVKRTYLGDASFFVFITGETQEETYEIYNKLQKPTWSMYLGKKAFAPTFPFILGLVETQTKVREAEARLLEIQEGT